MRLIDKEADFEQVEEMAKDCINFSEDLPEKVFSPKLQYYWFSAFDDLFIAQFFKGVKEFQRLQKESRVFVLTMDPDPREYLYKHFGFYGAFEFEVSDDVKSYISALNDFPEDSPADAMIHHANRLAFVSETRTWCIYGNRIDDIAIYAFSSRSQMEAFAACFGNNPVPDVSAAARYAYGLSGNLGKMKKLEQNYCFPADMRP